MDETLLWWDGIGAEASRSDSPPKAGANVGLSRVRWRPRSMWLVELGIKGLVMNGLSFVFNYHYLLPTSFRVGSESLLDLIPSTMQLRLNDPSEVEFIGARTLLSTPTRQT
ncbi:hypothetical protein RSAG8_06403, partial [Rhizoctonia solani AG-8 WAC10335]